jgi:hypothetical protein
MRRPARFPRFVCRRETSGTKIVLSNPAAAEFGAGRRRGLWPQVGLSDRQAGRAGPFSLPPSLSPILTIPQA